MALDLDLLPLYDPLTKNSKENMSSIWTDSLATYHQTLIGYLSQYGMFIPKVTTAQRNTIQSPVNGQMIYNTTTDTFQGYQAGAWKTFTLT